VTPPPTPAQVVVVGAGPVGVTAANLLGSYGIETVVLDREVEVIDYPRAVGVDDESLRTFQAIGSADEIMRRGIQNVPLKLFDGRGRCLVDVRPSTREYGWYKRNIFMQPWAERVLRAGLDRFDHVALRLGQELETLEQDPDGVLLTTRDRTGRQQSYRADFVIAADGGRSTVRGLLGIGLQGSTHERRWVVIDCANDPLDAPWTGLHADPRRPYVCAHLPDDHRRWEFMLFPDEDADDFLRPERVRHLLGQHVADPAGLDVIRARVYTHHSRLAERFVQGRVALAGDAAHLMPPWAGQGMNTGIRDVANLCWKLAAVVHGEAARSLLDSYQTERRPQARAMIDLSTNLGRFLSPTGRVTAALRDAALTVTSATPGVRRWLTEMRFKPVPDYGNGFAAERPPTRPPTRVPTIGRSIPQPAVETQDGARVRLDDVLGTGFALLGFECDPLAAFGEPELATVDALHARVIKVVESRAGQRRHREPCVHPGTQVVEDVDNELRGWFLARQPRVVLVRPDRYIAAAGSAAELVPMIGELASRFLTGPGPRSNRIPVPTTHPEQAAGPDGSHER
jgi:3-(3-hydroxy-phenyl)propionate hydroxylase